MLLSALPGRRDALDEVEYGQQQGRLGVSAHFQEIVLAEVAVDVREQVALGMFAVELRDQFGSEFGGLPIVKPHPRRKVLDAGHLQLRGHHIPAVPALLHCQEPDE